MPIETSAFIMIKYHCSRVPHAARNGGSVKHHQSPVHRLKLCSRPGINVISSCSGKIVAALQEWKVSIAVVTGISSSVLIDMHFQNWLVPWMIVLHTEEACIFI